ncbi:MAG: FAD-dependent oxidoreductase [Verrucomicrobiales bacterium]|nr:FAD-dependent oxidoreductase [Verrucomicrobiales bacterium]
MKYVCYFSAVLMTVLLTAQEAIMESAREIPVAYDVDVVVVGGTTGAITAAVEAAEQGASVFLAAPRPYLGEDVAGTLRLWLEKDVKPESDLEKALFVRKDLIEKFPNRLPFTYEADQTPSKKHADPGNKLLSDSRWHYAVNQSVQFDDDVTIIADLGQMARVKDIHLMSFHRSGDFEVGEVEVWTSPNGKLWRSLGKVEDREIFDGSDAVVQWDLEVKQPCRYVKLSARKPEGGSRMLLGELLIIEDSKVKVETTENILPATPMQAKIALDDALLAAGVQYLYGSMVTDILVDETNQPAGIVMANRAGRQAVRAKVVIDATTRATAARAAGAEFAPFPAGKHTFRRIVSGGTAKSGEGISVETADVKFYSQEGAHDVFLYDLEIDMPDNSPASFARAEVLARELTFDVALVDESDVLYQIPPDPVVAKTPGKTPEVSLGNLQPAGLDRFYILSGCADVPREAAAELMHPLNLMRLGKQVGAAAAELAKATELSGAVVVKGTPVGDAKSHGEVREFLNGTRPTHAPSETVHSAERSIPVLGSYDVVVAGGGTGGAPAGIGAGRKGASTLVVEYQDHLGGVGTVGLISSYYHGYRKGFTAEVDKTIREMGGPKRKGGWNPVAKRELWRNENTSAGTDIWYSTFASGALVEDGKVIGIIVTTPQGRGAVLAKAVVDSTGNSDIAVAAGADFITTSAEHVAMQGTGLSPRQLGTGYKNTDYSFADESDPVDQWRMIVAARQKYRSSYDLSTFIDSRERRRIVGDAFVSPVDIINQRTWHDTISLHQSNFDTHGYTVDPVFMINFPDKKDMIANVPYRALLPKGLDGIIVTGLGMSAHRDSMPILRMQPCIQNQGYAAGVAAATIAEQNIPMRSLDIKALQKHLVEIDSLPEEVLEATEAKEVSDETIQAAVESVVNEYRGLATLLSEDERAVPMLVKAFQKADSDEDKLVYANILGMLGDSTGAKVLAREISSQDWDEGWNFRGMGQFGGSISRLDSHIIALGKSGDAKTALPVIFEKMKTLDASKEFSHHRAVSLALESLRDPSGAKALAEVLAKDGMTGYEITEIEESKRQEQRSEPLREIILARALYRCGDHNGVGESILKKYEQDLRALFAQHAHAILKE